MFTAKCPICEERIDLSKKVKYLERVTCPTCDALLEVVNMDPLQLDWIYYDEYYDSKGKERSMNPRSAKCPLCREVVYIGSHAKVGGRVLCPGCDAQLEIVSMVPIELDWPYDAEYDSYFQDDDSIEESFDDPMN